MLFLNMADLIRVMSRPFPRDCGWIYSPSIARLARLWLDVSRGSTSPSSMTGKYFLSSGQPWLGMGCLATGFFATSTGQGSPPHVVHR